MTADDRADRELLLHGPRTCRVCFHHMDPWRSATGRRAWRCLHCDRFEI